MLLNENRNRLSHVDAAPVTGVTEGVRGDMKILGDPGGSPADNTMYVCLVTGVGDGAGNVVWGTIAITLI